MTIGITSLKSALLSTVLWAFIAMAVYVISLGDIFSIDWKTIANIGALSLLTGLVSLIKNYLTNSDGVAVGMQIK